MLIWLIVIKGKFLFYWSVKEIYVVWVITNTKQFESILQL